MARVLPADPVAPFLPLKEEEEEEEEEEAWRGMPGGRSFPPSPSSLDLEFRPLPDPNIPSADGHRRIPNPLFRSSNGGLELSSNGLVKMQWHLALGLQRLILGACWHLIHLMISIVHVAIRPFQLFKWYLISIGLPKRYQVLQLDKLESLAIVFGDEDVKQFSIIIKLLNWVVNIGVRNVILYDRRGVLKNSVSALEKLSNLNIVGSKDPKLVALGSVISGGKLSIEVLSCSDGKEAAAKAATQLCSKYSKDDSLAGDNRGLVISEADVINTFKAMGFGVSEPHLLLVFGPTRYHLGFPPWRMRYTEIVHMGPVKSLKYGALVKVFYDFSTKNQNYGK